MLAANAIENPRLMLASGLRGSSGLMGRNFMDHAYLLAWGLLPEVAGTFRGTNCTGGITDLRGGRFRRRQAAFTVDIHNDGWGWARGAPMTDLIDLVDSGGRYGESLRQGLVDRVSRQLQLAFMVEVPANPSNRVTVDPTLTDNLGNMRPVLTYDIPDYTMRGIAYARRAVQADLRPAGRRGPHRLRTELLGLRRLRGRGLRDPRGQPPRRHAHDGPRPVDLGGGRRSAVPGTTRTSTWSAGGACPPWAPRT